MLESPSMIILTPLRALLHDSMNWCKCIKTSEITSRLEIRLNIRHFWTYGYAHACQLHEYCTIVARIARIIQDRKEEFFGQVTHIQGGHRYEH